jgi:hypothetical protein
MLDRQPNVNTLLVRELRGTIEREDAPIGVLFSMNEPTAEMRLEAKKAGVWHSRTWGRGYPRIQLITVAEAFAGKRVDYPGQDVTLQAAPVEDAGGEQAHLPGMEPWRNEAKPRRRRPGR